MERSEIYKMIDQERDRQDGKWGEQNHHPGKWALIIAEEAGEVAKSCLEGDDTQYIKELVEVAASAVCAVESYHRQAKRKGIVYDASVAVAESGVFSTKAIFTLLSEFSFCPMSELRDLLCFIDGGNSNDAPDYFVMARSAICAQKLKKLLERTIWWKDGFENMLACDLDEIFSSMTPDQCTAWVDAKIAEFTLPRAFLLEKDKQGMLLVRGVRG